MTAGITPWMLSAKSASALGGTAAALQRMLDDEPDTDPTDIAYALGSRTPLRHRAVIVGAGRGELLAGLRAIASGTPSPRVITGRATRAGRTVFVFPGQGSLRAGMANELLDTAEAFAEQMRRCDDAFGEFLDWSLIKTLRGAPGSPGLDRDDVAQPVLFAVMVSLAAQWRALGIEPDAVVGHSQGEVAAAYVAGALSLRDAARVLCAQCQAITGIEGSGSTVFIPEPVDQVCELIGPWDGSIAIAERNSPSSTVVAGSAVAIADLVARCERDHLPVKRIPLPYASHSVHMEELRERLRRQLADVRPRPATITFISTVTGAAAGAAVLDGDYWFANLRQPVLFEDAVRWAYGRGHRTFIECSPERALSADIEESLDDCGDDATVVGTLRRDDSSMRRFLMSLAEAHVRGTSPNWTRVLGAW
ncbi:acyltransferase domain-containing protein [Mycolicibacterium sp. ELW1]|uniref:acyltransferase domain-containing protein n=1 Tax=Mycobacteriaceae TaxID=1762 RepID=UPI00143DB35E|nr:acyltransferase domain-containing protein [Mycobacterium sp. ELW1]